MAALFEISCPRLRDFPFSYFRPPWSILFAGLFPVMFYGTCLDSYDEN